MRYLLSSKIKALTLVEQLSQPMKEVLGDTTSFDPSDITTYSLSVNINNVE